MELLADADTTVATRFERLRVGRLNGIVKPGRVSHWLSRMFAEHSATDVRDELHELVPHFRREHAS